MAQGPGTATGPQLYDGRIVPLRPDAPAILRLRALQGSGSFSFYSKRSTGNPLGTDRGISLRRLCGPAR
jgi:hypothetical protein